MTYRCWVIILALLSPVSFGRNVPLHKRSVEDILKEYVIIGDFSLKPEVRDNAKEIFWRYSVKLPVPTFEIKLTPITDKKIRDEIPLTKGEGRAIEHLNRGRVLFLNGEFDEARKTWLGGRARYGTSYDYHRRADFLIGNGFLYDAFKKLKLHKDYQQEEVREAFVNASTFHSWAYGLKKNIPDPVLDHLAPRSFYRLAAIYFTYKRWSSAFGVVDDGMKFLRKTGRKDYRVKLRRMRSELYIKNRDYLSAVQQLDIALRQDKNLEEAAMIFARIGDIYFDLNNFELAEDMYRLAIRLDRSEGRIRPWQYILRGECLFWLGKFNESIKMMKYGLASLSSRNVVKDLPFEFQALGSIRIADSYLALGKIEKAKLAYYQHQKEFRAHETKHVADLRTACLELPFYEGNNINHARDELARLKTETTLPVVAQELVWTCEIASYAQHERSRELVSKVKDFYKKYPRSEFLKSLVGPVREIQSREIESFFEAGDIHGAVDFFEKSRKTLFPTVPKEYQSLLFKAYVDIYQSPKSREFYKSYRAKTDQDYLRLATMLSEVSHPGQTKWQSENKKIGRQLRKRAWALKYSKSSHLYIDRILASPGRGHHYLWIYDLAASWVEGDFGVACDIIYPVLQRLGDGEKGFSKPAFLAKSRLFIDKYLEDMLKYETYCAYSVLEFEMELFKSKPTSLAKQYLKRDFVPINEVTAGLFFSLGELNYSAGKKEIAKSLWQKIVENGDPSLPEVKYAKTRLDTRRTELEKLWK